MRNLFKKLFPQVNKKGDKGNQGVMKRKEEKKLFAGYFVLVVLSHTEYTNNLGKISIRPLEWCLGEIVTTVTFIEGQEKNTQVSIQILNIPESITSTCEDKQCEEWQANDTGMIPTFENNAVFRNHQMLMRLDTIDPKSRFVWEKGKIVTVTANLVHRATYTNLMKLMLTT